MRLLFISLMAVVLVSPTASAHAQLLEELAAACTRELKICPDGTGVGRTGPNCEFAPCPGEDNYDVPGHSEGAMPEPAPPAPRPPERMCTMDAKICPDGTGVGRTGPNCEFAPCPGEGEQDPPEPEDEQEDEPGGQEEGWSY